MRRDAAEGTIAPGYDITPDLAQAVNTLALARQLGRPVGELVRQVDLDRAPISSVAEGLLRSMFRDDAMRKPVGRPVFADRLQRYADEAQKQTGSDIFGEAPPAPLDILNAVRSAIEKTPEKGGKLLLQAQPANALALPRGDRVQPSIAATTAGAKTQRVGQAAAITAGPQRAQWQRDTADAIQKVFSPTSRSGAKPMEYTIRRHAAKMAASLERTIESLGGFARQVARLPRDAQLDLWDRMERGLPIDPQWQPMAVAVRRQLDQWGHAVQSLGTDLRFRMTDDYMGRAFRNYRQWAEASPTPPPGAPATAQAALQRAYNAAGGKRPLLGSRGFLRGRTFDYLADAVQVPHFDAKGNAIYLEPITTNPVEMQILKLREMQRYYHGSRMADVIKQSGVATWVPWNLRRQVEMAGWQRLDDAVFQPRLPPAVAEHFNAFDPDVRAGLEAVANYLGVNITRKLRDPILKAGTIGYTGRGNADVIARFGGTEAVEMHEIGHQIDNRFGLAGYMRRDPAAWSELQTLADARATGTALQDPKFVAYLHSPSERIANLIHAYWYAPDLLAQVAPRAKALLETFLAGNPALKRVMDLVQPSVKFQGETLEEYFPGSRDLGGWYAPEPAARIFNNYMSAGWRGNPIYDGINAFNHALNLLQLGLSGFRATFVAGDQMKSSLALALGQLRHGRTGQAAANALRSVPPVGLLYSLPSTMREGSRLRNAVLDPSSITDPWTRQLVDAFLTGGQRVSMDPSYGVVRSGSFYKHLADLWQPQTAVHDAMQMFRDAPGLAKVVVPLKIAGRALQTLSEPLMGFLVPRVKLGVFSRYATDWIERHPNAPYPEYQAAMTQIADMVDARMGQMVYDKLFWQKSMKDAAFLMTRAVGWNLGTIRAFGGAAYDVGYNIGQRLRGMTPDESAHRLSAG